MRIGNKIYGWINSARLADRIDNGVTKALIKKKDQGQVLITDEEIDDIIDSVINEESNKKYEPEFITLEQVKVKFMEQYTSGKHTWEDGYLTNKMKVRLMHEIAEIYASQFKLNYT